MPWKRCLAGNLIVLMVCVTVTLIAAALYGLLQAGGDTTGATAVCGVLWVGLGTTAVSALGQLVLLSLTMLAQHSDPAVPPPDSPTSA